MRSIRWLAAGASALALALSACGTGGTQGQPTTGAAPTTAAKPTAAAKASPAASPAMAASPKPATSPAASPVAAGGPKPTVRMGSANFPEQVILGELYAQVLEANGYTVDRKLNLGTREIVEPALESGQIDIYPEYLATLLLFVDKNAKGSPDPAETQKSLQAALQPKNITVLDYAPAVDTNGFVVTRATADKYTLAKLSDLQPVADQLTLGGAPECPTRPFCLIGLKETYGLTFKDFKPLDTGGPLTVQALLGNQIDVGELFTTDPAIPQQNFVLLEDDKHLQLSDNVAPVVRNDLLSRAPDLKSLADSVSAKLTTEELTDLNKQVGVDRKDAKDVAAGWLRSKGLVK